MSSLNQNQLSAAKSKVPSPNNVEYVRHTDGDTKDIIDVILYADKYKDYMNSKDMANVASRLRSEDPMQTLYNVWYFVKHNIEYKADKVGEERIKDAKVLWDMRVGDCKSFSLMIGSILRNYKDIGFSYRFVGYKSRLFSTPDYTHVYVIAEVKGRSKPVIIDSTINDFDYEVPYSLNNDYKMTRIVHMTGIQAPNYNKGAGPSKAERFADAPRRAIRVSDIKNIPSLTEGQLSLNLLLQSLEIDEAYYGKSKAINEGKLLIQRALQTGSNGITGYVDTPLGIEVAGLVDMYIRRNNGALNFFNNSISGPLEDRDNAIALCRKKYPVAQEKNKFGVLVDKFGDPNYSKLYTCITEANQIYNILNSKQFVEGAHHMLYEFNDYNFPDSAVIAKTISHRNAITGWGHVVGTSRDNVRLYAANGIKQTSAVSGKLLDISPEGNINIIKEAYLYKGTGKVPGIKEPASAAVVAIVLAVIALAAKGMDYLIDRQRLRSKLENGMGDVKFGPEWQDFLKAQEDLKNTQKTNNYLALGTAAAAFGLLFIPSSNKKS